MNLSEVFFCSNKILHRNGTVECVNAAYMSRVVRKPTFCICENKDTDQLRGNREADQRLCFFATLIVQSLYFLNPKFQVSSHLLWLCRPVCVGPARKPEDRFSHNEAHTETICTETKRIGSLCLRFLAGLL